jgi:DNA replication protein DnaC
MEARDEKRLLQLQRKLAKVKLLIIDELASCRSAKLAPNCSSS